MNAVANDVQLNVNPPIKGQVGYAKNYWTKRSLNDFDPLKFGVFKATFAGEQLGTRHSMQTGRRTVFRRLRLKTSFVEGCTALGSEEVRGVTITRGEATDLGTEATYGLARDL